MKATLRDTIAIAAMEAIISKIEVDESSCFDNCEKEKMVARGAYSYADAMLSERDK